MAQRKLPVLHKMPSVLDDDDHVQLEAESLNGHAWHHQQPRKRGLVNAMGACAPCRKGKRKCDGAKPICAACRKRTIDATHCLYDQLEGFSRAGTLKHNLQSMKDEQDCLRLFVEDLLRVVPENTIKQCLSDHDHTALARALGGDANRTLDSMRSRRPDGDVRDADDNSLHYSGLSTPSKSEWISPDRTTFSMGTSGSFGLQLPSGSPLSPHDSILGTGPSSSSISIARSASDHSLASRHSCQSYDNHTTRDRRMFISNQTPSIQTYEPYSTTTAGYLRVYGHLPNDTTNSTETTLPLSHVVDMEIPLFMIPPMIVRGSDSPLSKAIVSFMDLARERIAEGWNVERILGPVHFDVSRVLDHQGGYDPDYDEFSVPGWATSVMLTYSGINVLNRLSALLRFSRIMRWLVVPSAANYALLAEGSRPTPMQLLVPHIAEYDFLTLPVMRDALISRPRQWTPDVPQALCCLWDENLPYTMADPITNTVRVTPFFEEFTSRDVNWAIDANILKQFPEIHGKVQTIRVDR